MEFKDFDQEIDLLLRQAARGERAPASPKSAHHGSPPHLDAAEISAFAENALPEKTKALYSEHLADCGRCRKILANTIALNAESSVETAHAPPKTAAAAQISWYKNLFAVPKMTFATGALVLVFAGLVAFTFLKNSNDSANSEIAQQSEAPEKMNGPNAGESAPVIGSNQMAQSNGGSMMSSNSAMTNSGSAMSNASAAGLPPVVSLPSGSMSNGTAASNSAAASNKRSDTANEALKSPAESPVTAADQIVAADESANFADQRKATASEERTRLAADDNRVKSDAAAKPAPPVAKRSAPRELPVNGRNTIDLDNARPPTSSLSAAEIRTTGGKTFRRENGAWYDQSYKGQSTTNVARGSEDFKKLDANLRSIAGSLSGTVVIVYSGKAYRIQ